MLRLNEDVISLILEELKDEKKSIYSCLLIDRTWCKIAVQFLWKNPWKNFRKKQLNIILLHLSSKSKETLRSQGINLPHQNLLFNYIGFCKYLNIYKLQNAISAMNIDKYIEIEVFNLFINDKMKFTHLYIQSEFIFQMKLISGVVCFSDLKSFQFSTDINQEFLKELVNMSKSKSIKELTVIVSSSNNSSETIELIKTQKNLNNIHFRCQPKIRNESICMLLEESVIKHADTIQSLTIGWKPITKVLSHLKNLISLKLELSLSYNKSWNHLENLSLPVLKILKAKFVPSKILVGLIENTRGDLNEISIHLQNDANNKGLIQTIYQNSSNLKYLKVQLTKNIISELLLINCQNLDGLVIIASREKFDWDALFKTLTKSSPTTLFKFKFHFYFDEKPSLDSLESFFNDWKGRHPMLLQIFQIDVPLTNEYSNLFEKHKTKGIIKIYNFNDYFEDFEWIQKRTYIN